MTAGSNNNNPNNIAHALAFISERLAFLDALTKSESRLIQSALSAEEKVKLVNSLSALQLSEPQTLEELASIANEAKKNYRKLALTCHPDKFPDNPEKAEQFIQLTAANEFIANYSNTVLPSIMHKTGFDAYYRAIADKHNQFKDQYMARINSNKSDKEIDAIYAEAELQNHQTDDDFNKAIFNEVSKRSMEKAVQYATAGISDPRKLHIYQSLNTLVSNAALVEATTPEQKLQLNHRANFVQQAVSTRLATTVMVIKVQIFYVFAVIARVFSLQQSKQDSNAAQGQATIKSNPNEAVEHAKQGAKAEFQPAGLLIAPPVEVARPSAISAPAA